MNTTLFVSPSEIERETGLSQDQLRKWRQRFEFPPVEARADGRAAYSRATVKQLLLIKRLLEGGFRPAQVVGKTAIELETLILTLGQSVPALYRDETSTVFIALLKQRDLVGFGVLLAEQRSQQTLYGFVRDTVAPLLISIGDAWSRGELDIHDEHLCTSCIERYLHAQIFALQPKHEFPIVLFALPPGEHHLIGLMMVEAVLAEQGARTISIGSDIPLNYLKLAAISYKVDAVALSFSFAYPAREVVPTLLHLRRLLPLKIQIWAGGAGVAGIKKNPKGIRIFPDFEDTVVALHGLVPPALTAHTATEMV